MNNLKPYLLLGFVLAYSSSCKHPFDPPKIPLNKNPLVVEGFINASTDSETVIWLSRVQNFGETDSSLAESGAVIFLEGEDGSNFPLLNEEQGKYISDRLNLSLYKKYRLNISTSDGNQYQSDFVKAKKSQPIDSLAWEQNSDVTIFVNTHDPLDSTIYYRWDYIETWNYLSNLSTPWGVENRRIFAKDSLTQTDSCWRNQNSTEVVIGNSLALSQDLISHYPIATVPINSEKISNRYSILVRQYALTNEAYQFFLTLKKNTQQTGTLFDPQPSQLPTNIHCLTNPAEKIIGFIYASSMTERRIFINHREVQNWHYQGQEQDCENLVHTFADPVDFRIFDYPDTTFAPYYFQSGGGLVLVRKSCTYCTYYGGTNVKPSFW